MKEMVLFIGGGGIIRPIRGKSGYNLSWKAEKNTEKKLRESDKENFIGSVFRLKMGGKVQPCT